MFKDVSSHQMDFKHFEDRDCILLSLFFFNTLFRNLTMKGGSKGEAVGTPPLYLADTFSSPHPLLCAHIDALNKRILFHRQGL